MRKLDISSDSFTCAYLLKSFVSSRRLQSCEMVHAHVFKFGFVYDMVFINTLLDFYDKSGGGLLVVKKLFDEMPRRDAVSWKTIIRRHMSCGEVDCAISLLNPMPLTTWSTVVCGLVNDGDMDFADEVFERMPRRNSVSCNAMIQGFEKNSMVFEAFLVFDEMLARGGRCKPHEATLITIISECGRNRLLEQGKWLCSFIEENKFILSLPLGNALIDMFVVTGDLHNVAIIFKKMSRRCTITWRTMIDGLVRNGYEREAIKLFDIMCAEGGQKPDDHILTSLLIAFEQDPGLVGDGKKLFSLLHLMVHDFGLELSENQYWSIIQICNQVGWIEAAVMLMENMPSKPLPFVWGEILFACRIHGHKNLLESLFTKILNEKSNDLKYLRMALFGIALEIRDYDSNSRKLMLEPFTRIVGDRKSNDPTAEWLISQLDLSSNQNGDESFHDVCLVHERETPAHQEILEGLVGQLVCHENSVYEELVDCFDW